jgi:hypothetical protein
MKNSNTSNRVLVAILMLQGLTLANLWVTGPGMTSTAHAQVSDPGAQRIEMIKELEATNEKLDRLISILESGNLQVKVCMPDEVKQAN